MDCLESEKFLGGYSLRRSPTFPLPLDSETSMDLCGGDLINIPSVL